MKKLLLPIAAALMLSACGTTQSVSMADLSRPIAKGETRLYVERDSSMLFLAAPVTVTANGGKIASLGRGGSVAHDVRAGATVLSVSTPSAPGQFTVRFDARAGQVYRFRASPKSDALLLGSAFGIVGDAVHAQISDTSGYFQIEMLP